MSALSTPGGGGTSAQSKPTSGKQKYQKLDINSLYCTNKNESSEPSSVKSQLSRKHGMQSLGKVPSARRPPANLPSLKTETGQDPNANPVPAAATTAPAPATCTTQITTVAPSSGAAAGAPGGWVPLPPPPTPYSRTEFPSLEASAQPSHRSADHVTPQPQLRPQTEGSWTCGGTAGVRSDGASAASAASAQQPHYRAIVPAFLDCTNTPLSPQLIKGSTGGGLGLQRGARPAPRPPAPRAVEVLTARPILREEQISSLDDIARDAGWAQHDDIDYDQKLDFSDGESSAPSSGKGNQKNNHNRAPIDMDRVVDPKVHEVGDEEQIWAERRQKQNNEIAQVVARARQRKAEEHRRQMTDSTAPQPHKDARDRDRNDNRDREADVREKDRTDRDRERTDNRDRIDNRDKLSNDSRDRDTRDKERVDHRDRDRMDNRERFDNRDRNRDIREHDRMDTRDRGRMDNRDQRDGEKDVRDRDRNDNRPERDRFDRDRPDNRDRDRGDRDRDRDRDFRDRDYGRDREQNNAAFSKTSFQQNIPPRFLKQQQNRQQDDQQHKGWAFSGKQGSRRQDQPTYNAPRHAPHNGRRSYSRDYSDREDEFRRDSKDAPPGPQWRSEMQDFDKVGRELDRSNSKESYKDFSDHKDRRSDSDRKSVESSTEQISKPSAAEKLAEVFERKSVGIAETFSSDSSHAPATDKRNSPASSSQRESSERDFGKTSWAEASQEDHSNFNATKPPPEKPGLSNENDQKPKDGNLDNDEAKRQAQHAGPVQPSQQAAPPANSVITPFSSQGQNKYHSNQGQNFAHNQSPQINSFSNIQPQPAALSHSQSFTDNQISKTPNLPLNKPLNPEPLSNPHLQIPPTEQVVMNAKPIFASQKSEKELSESESVASKGSTDPATAPVTKTNEAPSVESLHSGAESQKRNVDDKRHERFNDPLHKAINKEPIERKSSGSGSEKKGRGYGGGSGGGCGVYRGWASREARGRRPHHSSHSNNRASDSDGSTDGAPNTERKERRRAPRSPRGPKKSERPDDPNRPHHPDQGPPNEPVENREPFAPRGQPSRRGRGSFQGSTRPPAPAKRVTGYGPPNTKSPFSLANRAVKDMEDSKDYVPIDDKGKSGNKPRTASSLGRGRDRRPKGPTGPHSGEDENWETTSEHSEGGGSSGRRRSVGARSANQSHKGQGRNQPPGNRPNPSRNSQPSKKDALVDNKTVDITEAMTDLKISVVKKEDEVADDGFQEVRNKKTSKDARGPPAKEEIQNIAKQPRSHSNQGGGRNGSSTRNTNDKSNNSRGSAPVSGKTGPQYDRTRQTNLAPRFVKQRQKQQLGLITAFGPDTGAAPPPPPVNAWDKPISQTLRANVEEPMEPVENKSGQSSQRSTPGEPPAESRPAPAPAPAASPAAPVAPAAAAPAAVPALATDKAGVLDGTSPPVETIIFENTNFKTAPPAEALKQKYQPTANTAIPQSQGDEISADVEARALTFNGDVRPPPRSIQELISERPVTDGESTLGLPMSFDASQKAEDSSDMKLDFAFDSDLGQLTEDKSAKTALGLPRSTHMSTSNTISPLAADLNLKIASVKKVWEMSAVAEGSEELQFAGFEEANTETGAQPNVCKVKPTQQLQSPPPQHYNHMGYQGGYGGLSVPSPPAVLFNSSQQLLGSSQQLPQQGGLYGAFLDQSRGQFGGFPGTPYGAGSAAPYNYQPPPDMFQSLPSQYRMAAAAGGGAAFGQSGQLGNSPSTVLISSTSNSLMSASVKPSTQQIGAIGSKGGAVGGVGGVGGVNTYQQQYLGYSGPVGEAPYSLPGLMPRPAPPASSYYSPYQPPAAPAPTYPLQFTQQQSGAFGSQFLSSQLQVAAAVQQMQQQQQYRAPMQQQFAPPAPQQRPPQQLKSPMHEHANGFAQLCEPASPTPGKPGKPNVQKPPHSPPQHKYHAPPPHPPPAHTPHAHHAPHPHQPHHQHQLHQHQPHLQHQQQMGGGNNGRCGGGMQRGGMSAPRYPAPIQRPHAPAMPLYRAPPAPARPHHAPRHALYYHHHQRNGAAAAERAEAEAPAEEAGAAPPDAPAEPKPE